MNRTFGVLLLLLFAATAARAQFPHEKTYNIEAVTVSSKGEDRAYRIMRNAIAHAPYYARQVSQYSAEVYLKGSFDVVKVSRLMRGMAGEAIRDFKEGENYMQESWNEIEFTAPDKYEQRVVRQLSSMPDGGEGVEEGAMRLVNINIYDTDALPFVVSPLSPGAFSHYRFVYEGYVEDRGRIINKIRITPVRRSQQLVSGHIFVAEDHWNVHGLDISGHMNLVAGIDFNLQSDYDMVAGDVWMPTRHRITFDVGLLNSKGIMRYTAAVKYGGVVVNDSLRAPKTDTPDASVAQGEPQKKFSNRDAYRAARQARREIEAPERESLDISGQYEDKFKLAVDSLARRPDPEFWDRVRPVALEPAELEGYRDRGVAAATAAPDTTSTGRRGKSTFNKILTGSKPLKLGERSGELLWNGVVPSRGGFNTVDGFYFGLAPVSYRKTFGSAGKTTLTVSPEVIWAINRHVAMGSVTARLRYAPMRRGEFTLGAGSMSRDFNGGEGIRPIENTVASLVFRRNYLKLYRDDFIEAGNSIDIANGLALSLSGRYSRRRGLENTSDYSLFFRKSRVYTPNTPMPDHTAAVFALNVEYTPRQYYRVSDGRKQPVRSPWPTFFAGWRKGVSGIGGSVTDFDHIGGGLRHNIDVGTGQWLQYYVRGGAFVNKRSLYFPDYRHFDTAEIPLVNGSIMTGPTFRLLEYYRYSTADRYIHAHVGYQARFLLLKLLPWFSNRLWQEGVQLNYLSTPVMKNYTELGYSIGLVWQAGVFVGFEGVKFRSVGVKLSLPIRISRSEASISL